MADYPFDTTGRSKDNLILNEEHTIGAVGDGYPYLMAVEGPFFKESMVVIDVTNSRKLDPYKDFKYAFPLEDGEEYLNRALYGGIYLTNPLAIGTYRLRYQNVGSEFITEETQSFGDGFANLTYLQTDWSELFSDYFGWPMTDTVVPLDGLDAVGELVDTIAKVRDGIPNKVSNLELDSIAGINTTLTEPVKESLEHLAGIHYLKDIKNRPRVFQVTSNAQTNLSSLSPNNGWVSTNLEVEIKQDGSYKIDWSVPDDVVALGYLKLRVVANAKYGLVVLDTANAKDGIVGLSKDDVVTLQVLPSQTISTTYFHTDESASTLTCTLVSTKETPDIDSNIVNLLPEPSYIYESRIAADKKDTRSINALHPMYWVGEMSSPDFGTVTKVNNDQSFILGGQLTTHNSVAEIFYSFINVDHALFLKDELTIVAGDTLTFAVTVPSNLQLYIVAYDRNKNVLLDYPLSQYLNNGVYTLPFSEWIDDFELSVLKGLGIRAVHIDYEVTDNTILSSVVDVNLTISQWALRDSDGVIKTVNKGYIDDVFTTDMGPSFNLDDCLKYSPSYLIEKARMLGYNNAIKIELGGLYYPALTTAPGVLTLNSSQGINSTILVWLQSFLDLSNELKEDNLPVTLSCPAVLSKSLLGDDSLALRSRNFDNVTIGDNEISIAGEWVGEYKVNPYSGIEESIGVFSQTENGRGIWYTNTANEIHNIRYADASVNAGFTILSRIDNIPADITENLFVIAFLNGHDNNVYLDITKDANQNWLNTVMRTLSSSLTTPTNVDHIIYSLSKIGYYSGRDQGDLLFAYGNNTVDLGLTSQSLTSLNATQEEACTALGEALGEAVHAILGPIKASNPLMLLGCELNVDNFIYKDSIVLDKINLPIDYFMNNRSYIDVLTLDVLGLIKDRNKDGITTKLHSYVKKLRYGFGMTQAVIGGMVVDGSSNLNNIESVIFAQGYLNDICQTYLFDSILKLDNQSLYYQQHNDKSRTLEMLNGLDDFITTHSEGVTTDFILSKDNLLVKGLNLESLYGYGSTDKMSLSEVQSLGIVANVYAYLSTGLDKFLDRAKTLWDAYVEFFYLGEGLPTIPEKTYVPNVVYAGPDIVEMSDTRHPVTWAGHTDTEIVFVGGEAIVDVELVKLFKVVDGRFKTAELEADFSGIDLAVDYFINYDGLALNVDGSVRSDIVNPTPGLVKLVESLDGTYRVNYLTRSTTAITAGDAMVIEPGWYKGIKSDYFNKPDAEALLGDAALLLYQATNDDTYLNGFNTIVETLKAMANVYQFTYYFRKVPGEEYTLDNRYGTVIENNDASLTKLGSGEFEALAPTGGSVALTESEFVMRLTSDSVWGVRMFADDFPDSLDVRFNVLSSGGVRYYGELYADLSVTPIIVDVEMLAMVKSLVGFYHLTSTNTIVVNNATVKNEMGLSIVDNHRAGKVSEVTLTADDDRVIYDLSRYGNIVPTSITYMTTANVDVALVVEDGDGWLWSVTLPSTATLWQTHAFTLSDFTLFSRQTNTGTAPTSLSLTDITELSLMRVDSAVTCSLYMLNDLPELITENELEGLIINSMTLELDSPDPYQVQFSDAQIEIPDYEYLPYCPGVQVYAKNTSYRYGDVEALKATPYAGVQYPMSWYLEPGLTDISVGFLNDAQLDYTTRRGIIGPVTPVYIWDRDSGTGSFSDLSVDSGEVDSKWQAKAFYAMARYLEYQSTKVIVVDSRPKDFCTKWVTYLANYAKDNVDAIPTIFNSTDTPVHGDWNGEMIADYLAACCLCKLGGLEHNDLDYIIGILVREIHNHWLVDAENDFVGVFSSDYENRVFDTLWYGSILRALSLFYKTL